MQTTTLPTKKNNLLANQDQIQRQIFIGGCSRSGTTLLGAMIGSHPDIICSPESQFKSDFLRRLWPQTDNLDTNAILNSLTKHWRFKLWELPESIEELASLTTEDSFASILNSLSLAYAKRHGKPNPTAWVDHTPENISYARSLLDIFPNAKFIHIIRDGRAVAASILPLDWGPNSIIKAARWWMRMTSFGLAAEADLGADRIMQVRYESLVLDPEPTIQQICQFLEIDYDESMLDAVGFIPPSYTNRQHKLVGLKPKPSMATRWQERLTQREIEIFEHQTRNFLHHLGYDLMYDLQAKGPSFIEVQLGKLKELYRGEFSNKLKWLVRSYPLWLTRDFYTFAKFSDTNN
ncbi:MAG: sulfotransferase [Chloroflexota bacterium]